jgi:sugar (pentulose or hexulose) kinase
LSYLGIDVGTSVAKLALFTADGDIVTTASRPVPLQHPAPGQVEQDPELVYAAVRELVGQVASYDVELIAVTGQGDGCWLLDGAGRPTRPAISWLDGRAAGILRDWERDGITDAMYAIGGNALFPGAQAPILRWLQEHAPDELDRSSTAAYCKDMIFQRLTGVRATDSSDASVPFGDGHGEYSAEALRLCGLEHRAGLLAPVVTPLPIGELSAGIGAGMGTVAGTPVVSGPFDMPSCSTGGGVRELGDGLLTIGTTLSSQVLVDRIDTGGEPAGMHLATAEPDRWIRVMAAMAGTASLDWTLALLGMRHDQLGDALAATTPGAGGVTALPYLAPSGERAPFVDPAARGQFDGLALTTTREDLVRALCEGLGYAARQCLEAAGLTGRLVVCGGGTRSLPWLRVFASVLGRPLEIARSPEVGARGAVMSALRATGREIDVPTWTRPEQVIDPEPADVEFYAAGYQHYLRRQAAARGLWPR